MLGRLLLSALEASAVLRPLRWRWWYGRLARNFTAGGWTFMNYGLVLPEGHELRLDAPDESDRSCIQLYHRVASAVDLTGLRLLEVGSGRGGGASYISRYLHPAHVTGTDFSPEAVVLSQKRHAAVPNLDFVLGDAEKLPFPDASFDAVLNVESSHCYGHVDRFFAEAVRVLCPGGYFLFADFRDAAAMPLLHGQIHAQRAWQLVASEDITAGVADALEADDERKRTIIEGAMPRRSRQHFGEFAGLVGGEMHRGFRNRTLLYQRFALRKTA